MKTHEDRLDEANRSLRIDDELRAAAYARERFVPPTPEQLREEAIRKAADAICVEFLGAYSEDEVDREVSRLRPYWPRQRGPDANPLMYLDDDGKPGILACENCEEMVRELRAGLDSRDALSDDWVRDILDAHERRSKTDD